MTELSSEQFAERTQDHLNKYIAAADQKASILLTGQFAFLGLTASTVNNLIETAGDTFLYLSIGMVVVGITGIFLSIVVIYPRTPSPEKGFIYWGNITAHSSAKEFQNAFEDLSESKLSNKLVTQNYMLAKVANKKYGYLRWSLRATALMVILASLAGIVYIM